MIIIMIDDPLNDETVEKFSPRQSFCKMTDLKTKPEGDERLVLLDITANGRFQACFYAEYIAEQLQKSGNLTSLKTIDFCISDLDTATNLVTLAQELAMVIKEKYSKSVAVRVISSVRHHITLLIPPETSQDSWEVYGIKRDKVPASFAPNLKSFCSLDHDRIGLAKSFETLLTEKSQSVSASVVVADPKSCVFDWSL